MLTTIELFAGAGGLALGVEKAGFDTLALIEFDKDACDTLKVNRPKWNVICDDIANVSCQDLEHLFGIKKGELDLLSGGAPCQAFSYAGKRLGFEDTRGTLFYHYAIFHLSNRGDVRHAVGDEPRGEEHPCRYGGPRPYHPVSATCPPDRTFQLFHF